MFKQPIAGNGRKRKTTHTLQVASRSDTHLELYSPLPQRNWEFTRFALLAVLTAIVIYGIWRAADLGSIIPTILGVPLAGIILGLMFASVLIALMPFATSFQHPVETFVVDHETEEAVMTTSVVWRLFRPQVQRYRLPEIVAVQLRRSESNLRLDLELKSGARVKLVDGSASDSSISEIGALISDFLAIPLLIDLGGPTPIETYPTPEEDDGA